MKVTVQCPNGHRFKTEQVHLGKAVRCPQPDCGVEFVLEAVAQAPPIEPQTAPPPPQSPAGPTPLPVAPVVETSYATPGPGLSAVPFSAGTCIAQGWRVMSANYGLFLGASAIYVLIQIGMAFVPILGVLAQLIVNPVLTAGWMFLGVLAFRGYRVTVGDLFGAFNRFGAILGIYYLTLLIVVGCFVPTGIGVGLALAVDISFESAPPFALIGLGSLVSLILLIVVVLRLIFANQVCLETGLGVIDSMRRSWAITGPIMFSLIGFLLLLAMILFLTMALLILPYFFLGIPLMIGAMGVAYGLAADQTPAASSAPAPPGT